MPTQITQFKLLPVGLKLMITWFVLNPALFPLFYWTMPDSGMSNSYDIIIVILAAITSWVIAFLLLQRKSWFRRVMVMFLCVALIVNIPTLGIMLFFQEGYNLLFCIVLVAFNIVFIWYLSKRNTKILFFEGSGIDINDEVALNFKLEIDRWNWGAYFLTWIWGLGNRVYIALLVFIPVVNLIILVLLGLKGNKWAWRARTWEGLERFKRSQRRWAIVGGIIWFICMGLVIGLGFLWWAHFKSIKDSLPSYERKLYNAESGYPVSLTSPTAQEDIPNDAPAPADTTGFKSLGADLFTDGSNIWYFNSQNGERLKLESVDAASFKLLGGTYPFVFKDKRLVWIFTGDDLFEISGADLSTFKKVFANSNTVYKDSLFVYVLSYNKKDNPNGEIVRFVTVEGADPSTIELVGSNPEQTSGAMPLLKDKDSQYEFDKQTLEYKRVE